MDILKVLIHTVSTTVVRGITTLFQMWFSAVSVLLLIFSYDNNPAPAFMLKCKKTTTYMNMLLTFLQSMCETVIC